MTISRAVLLMNSSAAPRNSGVGFALASPRRRSSAAIACARCRCCGVKNRLEFGDEFGIGLVNVNCNFHPFDKLAQYFSELYSRRLRVIEFYFVNAARGFFAGNRCNFELL